MKLRWSNKNFRKIWRSAFLAVVLVVGHYTRLFSPVENGAVALLKRLQAPLYQLAAKSGRRVVPLPVSQLDQLKFTDELNNLRVENTHLKTLLNETTLLEEQVNFLREQSFPAVHTKVIGYSSDALTPTIIIDKGTKDGITNEQAVIYQNGVLVGLVNDVHQETSEVLLITSERSLVNAAVQNAQQSSGIVKGEFNLTLTMNFLPQFDTVQKGDTIVTNGRDARVPAGLIIGNVEEVLKEPGAVFQKAIVNPWFETNELTIISVIVL